MRLYLDEMHPLSEHKAMLIARAVVLAHRDAARVNADVDEVRKQEYGYIEVMLQRARWAQQRRIEGEL